MSSTSPAWFRQHFNDDYPTLYAGRTQEQADAEVAFAVERLDICSRDRVLDLCCGHGRHLRSFAARGIPVVGVDLSDALLRRAPRDEGIRVVRADMRRLPFAGGVDSFSVLVNFFTSFGYFDSEDDNAAAVREMARILAPGGRFLLDLMNLHATLDSLAPRTERRAGPFEVVEERWFDGSRRRIEKRIRLVDSRSGERREYIESVRVYEEDEIRELLTSEGLDVERVFGDFAGSEAGGQAPRMVLTGTRRKAAQTRTTTGSDDDADSAAAAAISATDDSVATTELPRFISIPLPATWRRQPLVPADDLSTGPPSADDIHQAARGVDGSALGDAFETTYSHGDLPLADAARRSLDALAATDACCVVTGQQPGFLGGPLLTLYKALSAIVTAERVESAHGRRCVPVFWVASEDHDIDEVRTARFPDGAGGETELSLPHASERAPLSTLAIDADSSEVRDRAARLFEGRHHGETARRLIDLYRGRTVAGGFAAIIASLLGEQGLLVISPESLRPLSRPLFRRIVKDAHGALDAVREGAHEVEARGLTPVVKPRLPLFIIRDGKRHHLSPAPVDGESAGCGPTLAKDELLRLVDEEPESFSAGALLRPLVERHTLPCALTIGGAAEIGYFAQLGPLARWLGVDAPRIDRRFHATLLDSRAGRAWDRLDIDVDRFASATSPEKLAATDESTATDAALAKLRENGRALCRELLDEHPGHPKGKERRGKTITHAIERLIDRVAIARTRADGERFTAATTIWSTAFPEGALQERRHGFLDLVARQGEAGVAALLDVVRRTGSTSRHQLVRLDGKRP